MEGQIYDLAKDFEDWPLTNVSPSITTIPSTLDMGWEKVRFPGRIKFFPRRRTFMEFLFLYYYTVPMEQ